MNYLPALFVSCDVEDIKLHGEAFSGPSRMVWGKHYDTVVLVSIDPCGASGKLHLNGEGSAAEKVYSLLKDNGLSPVVNPGGVSERRQQLNTLLSQRVTDLVEIRLSTGMALLDYQDVGRSLTLLRKQGALVISLDERKGLHCSRYGGAYNNYLRGILKRWVSGDSYVPSDMGSSLCLSDSAACVLNVAFSMGDFKFPQRIFSKHMSHGSNSAFGYGWLQ
ncbi:hypothetical protein [Halomonas sp. A11-A]|uniref:hypothetical protein n=1 Tax=Halomonas sp. A11-A TaxID=2183985 RepID=UPI000D9A6DF2|nr:hypothetical protein [Halomonas sp. A11-A]PWV69039.1 hypothetical protein DER72_13328 [Halomonas sp. A11-A]